MSCIERKSRKPGIDADVACFVTNFGNPGRHYEQNALLAHDAEKSIDGRKKAVATVAMEYSRVDGNEPSSDRIVKFYVFSGGEPEDERQSHAVLDEFVDGPRKFVPYVCLNCHGGSYPSNLNESQPASIDLGASFLPFDILSLRFPGYCRDQNDVTCQLQRTVPSTQEMGLLKELNSMVLTTQPQTGISQLINAGWYSPGITATLSVTQNYDYIPESWRECGNLHKQIYLEVIRPSCRTCHVASRNNDIVTDYGAFDSKRGKIRTYVYGRPDFRPRMPHSLVPYRNFHASANPNQPELLKQFLDDSPACDEFN